MRTWKEAFEELEEIKADFPMSHLTWIRDSITVRVYGDIDDPETEVEWK